MFWFLCNDSGWFFFSLGFVEIFRLPKQRMHTKFKQSLLSVLRHIIVIANVIIAIFIFTLLNSGKPHTSSPDKTYSCMNINMFVCVMVLPSKTKIQTTRRKKNPIIAYIFILLHCLVAIKCKSKWQRHQKCIRLRISQYLWESFVQNETLYAHPWEKPSPFRFTFCQTMSVYVLPLIHK